MSTSLPERSRAPLLAGDVTQVDALTTKLWGQIRLKSAAGLRTGPITAQVYMTEDRARFRVIETGGKTEFLSSLQFCKFILELRSTGRFDFERGPPSRRAAQLLGSEPEQPDSEPDVPAPLPPKRTSLSRSRRI